MRKLMLMASMLAMVALAVSPAFGQATAIQYEGDDIDTDSSFCNQVFTITANQVQYGDANAAAVDESQAIAEAANQLGVTNNQVLACFDSVAGGAVDGDVEQNVADDGGVVDDDDDGVLEVPGTEDVVGVDDDADGAVDEEDGTEEAVAEEVAAEEVAEVAADEAVEEAPKADEVAAQEAAAAEEAAVAELPDTGGASLLTLGAGALLVAGGLLARRIIR